MRIIPERIGATAVLVGLFGALEAQTALASGPVESVSDMPGAIVVDIAEGSIADPFGPFVFGSGPSAITATAISRDIDTGIIQDPTMPGFFDDTFSCNLFPEWCGEIDTAINPGDFMGRFDTGKDLIITFDTPVAGAGMSFYNSGNGSTLTTGSTITAYDGPQGTGSVIGSVTSPDTSEVCCPFSTPAPWYFIYFRGVTSDAGNIWSIVVSPTVASEGWGVDVIAVAPAGDAPCPADTNNDGELNGSDFFAWVAAFGSQGPGCDQNADGNCDASDFFAWVAAFGAGCP